MKTIKGFLPQKKQENPNTGRDLAESILGVSTLFSDLKSTKNDLVETVDQKIQEVDECIEEIEHEAEELMSKMDSKVAEFEQTALDLIEDIHNIPTIKGIDGKDADEEGMSERLEEKLLNKIPKIEAIIKELPTHDEIVSDVLSKIPQNKASLKVIQESVDLEKLTKSIKETLSVKDLKDWDERKKEIDAEISRSKRYQQVSGGGFNNIANVSGTVSTGLSTLRFTGSGVNSVTQSGQTVTVDISGGGGGSGETVAWSVNQTSHGFIVGDVIRSNGTANQYTKAQADSAPNAEVIGIVTAVADANNFTVTSHGRITTGVPTATANDVFFLSPTTAGALTATQPSTVGQVSLPMLTVIQSATSAFINLRRGFVIAAATTAKRVVVATDATSITPNSTNADWIEQANTQAVGTLTINADAGSPTNKQALGFEIKSTNIQTFSWNAQFVGGTNALPTATTGGGKIDFYTFLYSTTNSKWIFTGTQTNVT